MFIVLLRFAENRAAAGEHLAGHRQWIEQGLRDQVFLLAGGIQPGLGGAVLVHNLSLSQVRRRVAADPFVIHRVVDAEILEIAPGMADPRLEFLLPAPAGS
ncbi:YciI family protein [Actinoplanes siamensis]